MQFVSRIATRLTHKLNAAWEVLLAAAAAVIVLGLIIVSLASSATSLPPAQAEAPGAAMSESVLIRESQPGNLSPKISISPDGFRTANFSLRALIAFAYDVQGALISGPNALDTKYNVEAKAPGAFPAAGYEGMTNGRGPSC